MNVCHRLIGQLLMCKLINENVEHIKISFSFLCGYLIFSTLITFQLLSLVLNTRSQNWFQRKTNTLHHHSLSTFYFSLFLIYRVKKNYIFCLLLLFFSYVRANEINYHCKVLHRYRQQSNEWEGQRVRDRNSGKSFICSKTTENN